MFCVDSIRRSVFLVQICRLFELLTRFIHIMTLLVAMFAVPGCVYMLESVLFSLRSLVLTIRRRKDSRLFCRKCGAYF